MKRTGLSLGLGLSFFVAACGGEDTVEPPPAIQEDVALRTMSSCAELERYIEETAIRQMEADMNGWGAWFGPELDAATGGPTRAGGDESAAPTDYTTTNTQVEGVDEADFVKNDGTRIFVLAGRKLYLSRSWPPEDLSVLASRDIVGWPLEMFLDEAGRVVVFSSWWPEYRGADEFYCGPWGCGGHRPYTRVAVFSTANDRLDLERVTYLPGSYVSSRRIGASVRVVLREQLQLPSGLRWWPEDWRGDPSRDPEGFERAMDRVRAENARRIRAQTLNDWIPSGFFGTPDNPTYFNRACDRFHRPTAPARLGLTTVHTLNLSGSVPTTSRTSVLGEVGEIYASRERLYLASPHWWWSRFSGQRTYTYLHGFDIRNPSEARYIGSGGVPGYLLDQFSMDEHTGYLRVATTVETIAGSDDDWRVETSNRVTVLGRTQGRLVEVGSITGIAPGEQITSARFVGDKGFVVTFERIDPLFTLDLGNPFAPRIVGELEVPGFSSYIHPIDDDHLLTIGVDLPEPDANGRVDWSLRAMKLSVFDVSDFANPREKYTERVGTAHGWSEAGWNHKAFNWFPARNTLAIPFSDYRPHHSDYWGHFVSDLRLFEVDVNRGITPKGSVSLRDLFIEHAYRDWSWRYSPWVRRSVMADDYAYAISDAGIRVVDMRSPRQTIATARFDPYR